MILFYPWWLTWFYGAVGSLNAPPNSVLDTTPKNVLALMFLKHISSCCYEIITQKLARRLFWKSQFPTLLHLGNVNSFMKNWPEGPFGNLSFQPCLNVKTFP